MPSLQNKDGSLTAYALQCGYMEVFENNGVRVTLYYEHGIYHVRAHNHNNHQRLAWDSMRSLTDARSYYRFLVRRHK